MSLDRDPRRVRNRFRIADPGEANPFDPQAALGIAGGLAGNLGTLLNSAFLIFLAVCFILLEASSIPRKVRDAFGDSPELEERMTEIGKSRSVAISGSRP